MISKTRLLQLALACVLIVGILSYVSIYSILHESTKLETTTINRDNTAIQNLQSDIQATISNSREINANASITRKYANSLQENDAFANILRKYYKDQRYNEMENSKYLDITEEPGDSNEILRMRGKSDSDLLLNPFYDPLDDPHHLFLGKKIKKEDLIGPYMALQPMSLEEMTFCDNVKRPQIPNQITCRVKSPSKSPFVRQGIDVTCLSCFGNTASRFEDVRRVFRKKQYKEERKMILQNFTKDMKKKEIVLLSVNLGQLYLLLNWACGLELELGLNPREFSIIIPTDDETYERLTKMGFTAFPTNYTHELDPPIISDYTGQSNAGGHADINNIIMLAANEAIDEHITILMQDVDLVWTKDPRPYLRNAVFRRDFIAAPSRRWDAMGPLNSGFIYIQPTLISKAVLGTLENTCAIKFQSDQLIWNSLLRHHYFHQVFWRLLPEELFPTGLTDPANVPRHGKGMRVTSSAMIYHAVSSNKAGKLKQAGKYYFTKDKCPRYYDPNIPVVDSLGI